MAILGRPAQGNIKENQDPVLLLTHLPRDKMAAISQTIFLDAFLWMKSFKILTKISLKFVPKGSIDNNPTLVSIMAWRGIGNKPLSEAMLTQFTDTYMRQ